MGAVLEGNSELHLAEAESLSPPLLSQGFRVQLKDKVSEATWSSNRKLEVEPVHIPGRRF